MQYEIIELTSNGIRQAWYYTALELGCSGDFAMDDIHAIFIEMTTLRVGLSRLPRKTKAPTFCNGSGLTVDCLLLAGCFSQAFLGLGVLAFLSEAFVVFNELDVKTEAVEAISGGYGAIIVNRNPA